MVKPFSRCLAVGVLFSAMSPHSQAQGTMRVTSGTLEFGIDQGQLDLRAQSDLTMHADGSVVLPEFTSSGTADASAPFTFDGQLHVEATGETEPITGGGTATLHLRYSAEGPNWVVDSATYQFEHVNTKVNSQRVRSKTKTLACRKPGTVSRHYFESDGAEARGILIGAMTTLTPSCPRCRRADHVEEEEQTGSSASWFLCRRCGSRFKRQPA